MSPEQVKGLAVDARSDIFSFGAVVYEMLTGRKAFQAEGQRNLIGAILDMEPPPMSAIQPLVPAELERVVQKCLSKDPNDRWQTTRDLLDALKWTAAPVAPVSAARAHIAKPHSPRRGSGSRSRWRRDGLAVVASAGATDRTERPTSRHGLSRIARVGQLLAGRQDDGLHEQR